ncbi:ribonucleoprotein PTB-binding 2 isoform X14 [Hypanus sabinus]|uniref:ribonucleoprotein PTB-binding 2 isoform X14 n=1 Tax=Hypanus sabinus TaxID=79690 RepID=UPI0028C4B670|nr:ribonucleoprotein PTB-binding 2 isoform X14 [Hypanus sabinus]
MAAAPSDYRSALLRRDPAAMTGVLPVLSPQEIKRRLQRTRRALSNRRKILVKHLPPDSGSQDVYELLKDYELKYCYVDKNKGTAFVTLLNGEQAQDAIHKFHKSIFQGREISVQLQPTDSLLCITQLPHSYTEQQFEELVHRYGNMERCFLVYSETTGHSKGYGFVEYMKKDSAARAKSELMGKQLGSCILYVHWTDVDHLSPDFLHSKCLCIGKLPHEYKDAEELTQLFSQMFKPVFCQLAQGSGSQPSFAVVEYQTADQTELVQRSTNGMLIRGSHVNVSFCAPGLPGRSMLAALIAAQRLLLNNSKGLLPAPNPLQFINALGNPVLQLLLRPYFNGRAGKKSMLGTTCGLPVLPNPILTAALLQINQAQQNAALGNGLFQNLLQMHLTQQQLLMNKENPAINNKSSLLGDPPLLLQGAMELGSKFTSNPGKGVLAESSKGISVPAFCAELAKAAAQPAVGTSPFWSSERSLGQNVTEQKTKSNLVMGPPPLSAPIRQAHLQGIPNSVPGGFLASHQKEQTQQSTPMNGNFWETIQQWHQNSVTSHNSSEAFIPECGKEQCEIPAPTFVKTSFAPLETFHNQHLSTNADVDYGMAVQMMPSYYAERQSNFPRGVRTSKIYMQDPPSSAQQSLTPGDGILGPVPLGNIMNNIKVTVKSISVDWSKNLNIDYFIACLSALNTIGRIKLYFLFRFQWICIVIVLN